ncbi:hypothetical protein MKX01_001852 [Papaver californicum]|nr:hypothetical protein MKX01_001852 [Papaver californicum]
MCIRVDCNQCGKNSWMGCGKHVASIYANIEKGKHCMCKSWPGVVVLPMDEKSTGTSNQTGGALSAATTVETGK